MLSVQYTVSWMGISNAVVIILFMRTDTVAAVSSARGIVIGLTGATRDFPASSVQCTLSVLLTSLR